MTENKENNKWQSIFDENKAKYGFRGFGFVYRVFCKKTGVSYVGQSSDTDNLTMGKPNRIRTHYQVLKRGCHSMRELQESWDRYPEYFEDELLEIVDRKAYGKLSEREKHWQQVYKLEGSLQLESKKHYQLREFELKQLYEAKIINTKTLIYFVLKLKNPWCDRPLKIDPIAIAADYDIPESSAYKAIFQLKDLKVFTVGRSEMVIQWCHQENSQQNNANDNLDENPTSETELSDLRADSQILESIIKSENELSDLRMDYQILENEELETLPDKDFGISQTIQTDQTNQTIPPLPPQGEGEREKDFLPEPEAKDINGNGNQQTDNLSVGSQKSTLISPSKAEVILEDPFHRRCNMRRDKNTTQSLPDGPWMVEYQTQHGRTEKKLDINFIKYIADGWFKDPGFNKQGCKDIYWVMGDVIRYFEKDHRALRTRWEQYSMKFLAVYENAQMRIENGFEINPDEQKKLIDNARAIATPINPTLSNSPLEKIASLPKAENQEALSSADETVALPQTNWQNNIPEDADNAQAYKPYQAPKEEIEPMNPEQMEEIKRNIAARRASEATQTVDAHSIDNKFFQWMVNYFFKNEDLSKSESEKKAASTLKNKAEMVKLWKIYKQETQTIFDFVSVTLKSPQHEDLHQETERELLERELNDPLLNSEALVKARKCDKFSIDFDGVRWFVEEL